MTGTILVRNIREYGKRKGYSISEIENRLGFSAGLISRWKTMSPSVDKVVEIAKLLETTVETLVGNEDETNPADTSDQKYCEKLVELTTLYGTKWREFHEDLIFYRCMHDFLLSRRIDWSEGCYCKLNDGYFVLLIRLTEAKPEPFLIALADIHLRPQELSCTRESLLVLTEAASQELFSLLSQRTIQIFLNELAET